MGGEAAYAGSHLQQALVLFEAEGARIRRRVSAGSGRSTGGQATQAGLGSKRAFAALSAEEPDADFAALAAQLGRFHLRRGEFAGGRRSRLRCRSRSRSGCQRCSPRR